MKEFLAYQSEVAICMAAFSALYLLIWRNETNFQFKRLLLVFIPTLSLVIPLLDFTLAMDMPQPSTEYLAYIPNSLINAPIDTTAAAPEPISVWNILGALWATGVCFMLIRFGISLWKIWRINQTTDTSSDGGYKIVDDPIQSFSFFKLIVINKNQVESEAKDHILAHEKAHSEHNHSLDVIFLELTKIFQWFNPVCWLLARAVKQNLEFLADQIATRSAVNKKAYQYAIVHHANESGYQMLKSQFSKSNLNRRIIMMGQPNNYKVALGKLMLLFPLIAVLLMSFSIRVEKSGLQSELREAFPILNMESTRHQEKNQYPKITSQSLSKQSSHKEAQVKRRKIQGKVMDDNGNLVVGCQVTIKGTSEGTLTGGNGDFAINVASEHTQLIFQYAGSKTKEIPIGTATSIGVVLEEDKTYLTVSNDILQNKRNTANSSTLVNNMSSVKIGKPVYVENSIASSATSLTGTVKDQKGNAVVGCNVIIKGTTTGTVTDMQGHFKIGVQPEHAELVFSYVGLLTQIVEISDKTEYDIKMEVDENYQYPGPTMIGFRVLSSPSPEEHDSIASVMIRGDQGQPMFIVHGAEREDFVATDLNPDDIHSMHVIKGSNALDKYGAKGENGVILITTKSGKELSREINKARNSDLIDNIITDPKKPPLFIVDGKELQSEEIEKINPNDIESISVLKGKSANEAYGKKGNNGVILIKLKQK